MCFSAAMINAMTKRNLACIFMSITEGSVGRNSVRNREAGTEAESLLTSFPTACSACADIAQDHLPRGGTTHSGLGPCTSIISKENAASQSCLQVNVMETLIDTHSSSLVTLARVKLTIMNKQKPKANQDRK